MAMQRQNWSVNALAMELDLDRRTLAKRIQDVKPAQDDPKTYRLRDVLDVLCEYENFPDLERIDNTECRDGALVTFIHNLGGALRNQVPKTLRAWKVKESQIQDRTEDWLLMVSWISFCVLENMGITNEVLLKTAVKLKVDDSLMPVDECPEKELTHG